MVNPVLFAYCRYFVITEKSALFINLNSADTPNKNIFSILIAINKEISKE